MERKIKSSIRSKLRVFVYIVTDSLVIFENTKNKKKRKKKLNFSFCDFKNAKRERQRKKPHTHTHMIQDFVKLYYYIYGCFDGEWCSECRTLRSSQGQWTYYRPHKHPKYNATSTLNRSKCLHSILSKIDPTK